MKKITLHLCFLLTITISSNSFSQIKYFASNRVGNAINMYEEDGTFIEEFITQNAGGLSSPQDIILHPDGFLLVTGFFNSRLLKFDATSGDFIEEWSDPNFSLVSPSKMSIGPDNTIYVTQWGQTSETARVTRFDLEGNHLGGFTPIAPKSLGHTWDAEGNFYLALFGINAGEGTINKYTSEGDFISEFIDTSVLLSPSYFWFDDDGNTFVQDFIAGKVLKYDTNGQYIEDYIINLANPEGFTFLPNGHLLISQRGANQITEFDADGGLIGQWDNGGILDGPNFIKGLDYSLLDVKDFKKLDIIISQTIGNKFNISTKEPFKIKSAKILTLNGKVVTNLPINNSITWDARSTPNGVYIVSVTGKNNETYNLKIIVTN